LPENHLAYFVFDMIDPLDLSEIERHYEREERGYPPTQAKHTRASETVSA
jgi:hypothetical protein